MTVVRSAVIVAALLFGVACGGGDDGATPEPPAATGTEPDAAPTSGQAPSTDAPTTTEAPPSSTGEGFVFIGCSDGAGAAWELDPETGDVVELFAGFDGACTSIEDFEFARFTEAGRHLVLANGDGAGRIIVYDVEADEQTVVTIEEINAALTGTGLDAQARELEIAGFDRSDEGTVYLSEGGSVSGVFDNRAYFAIEVDDLAAGNLAAVQSLPDQRPCFTSYRWSPDGEHCIYVQTGVESVVPSASTDDSSTLLEGADHEWLDDSTIAARPDVGGGLLLTTLGTEEATTIYSSTGDRPIGVWVNPTSRSVVLVSATLDRSAMELYEIALEPGSEPELIASLDPELYPSIGSYVHPVPVPR